MIVPIVAIRQPNRGKISIREKRQLNHMIIIFRYLKDHVKRQHGVLVSLLEQFDDIGSDPKNEVCVELVAAPLVIDLDEEEEEQLDGLVIDIT